MPLNRHRLVGIVSQLYEGKRCVDDMAVEAAFLAKVMIVLRLENKIPIIGQILYLNWNLQIGERRYYRMSLGSDNPSCIWVVASDDGDRGY